MGAILHNWATTRVERNLYGASANLLANDASSSTSLRFVFSLVFNGEIVNFFLKWFLKCQTVLELRFELMWLTFLNGGWVVLNKEPPFYLMRLT